MCRRTQGARGRRISQVRPWVCPSFRWATIDLPPCVSPARARELGMERRHQQALMRGSSEGPRISTAGAWTLMGHACDFGGGSRSRPLPTAAGAVGGAVLAGDLILNGLIQDQRLTALASFMEDLDDDAEYPSTDDEIEAHGAGQSPLPSSRSPDVHSLLLVSMESSDSKGNGTDAGRGGQMRGRVYSKRALLF